MLAGEGSVDDADGTRHRFGAGDLVTLPRGWSGRWDVTSAETLHKVWVVHAHAEISGASTAAALLAEFADYPWAHLDIAGTAWNSATKPYIPRGGVGIGVRLLTQLALDWSRS